MSNSANEVADHILMLMQKYSSELRSHTQPARLAVLRSRDHSYRYNPKDALVRENLLEHVGMLPAVAVAIYPYVHDDQVDLGTSLIMLAIHDIGELVVGDVNTYVKDSSLDSGETSAALSLLHPSYHELYRDVEMLAATPSAKFARSVDKLAADAFELLLPYEFSVIRLREYAHLLPEEIMPAIAQRARPYMTWNPFISELYNEIYDRLAARPFMRQPKPAQSQ